MLEKLLRLREMSSAEVVHRLRSLGRKEADRLRWRIGAASHDTELEKLISTHDSSLKTYFRQLPLRRFYPSVHDRDKTTQFVMHHFPEWLERSIEEGIRLSEHHFNILGHEDVTLDGDIEWHRDPVSGHKWPRRYWADYDLVHSASADAKVIHELNRHQHLPRLGKAFFLTGDEFYGREAVGQIENWIDQNPKWSGVNWQSSLEIAIRSISWMWTVFLLLSSESLAETNLRRICRSLFAQLDHVYRYPSVYTSPNTHLIGEATALFIGGLLFQELPRAEAWYRFGTAILVDEFQKQVSTEGIYGEASSYYHCYATDFYLQALSLARWNRLPFPEWMWKRLEQMIEFVMQIGRPDGGVPLIGDDDGGRALALSSEDYSSFGDSLSSAAVLFGRPDFKSRAETFREESLWLLGDDAWQVFNSVDAQVPVEPSRAYLDSGVFIQRSGWSPEGTQVTFDCGGLGMQTGGHGHADALSLTLFSGGREILIDPATSVYNGEPEWRNFFRSTRAHNTVVVDGESQSQPGSSFSWKRKARTRVRKHIRLAEFEYVDGEHDGYLALPKPIAHRRRLIHVRPDYWIVLDDLVGRGEHQFDFLYHFASDAELFILGDEKIGDVDCRARIQESGLHLIMYGSTSIRAEAVCGQLNPIQGWASHRYGERHPSPVLRASMRGRAPVSMMTFMLPGTASTESMRFKADSHQVIAAMIRDGECDDIAIMCLQDGDLHLNNCVMRGEFFWMRTHNGNLQRVIAVNAQSFTFAGETVFESQQSVPYVQAYFWEDGIVIERGENEGKVYVRDLRDRQFQQN